MQKPPFLRSLQRYIQRRINLAGRRVFLRLCHYLRRLRNAVLKIGFCLLVSNLQYCFWRLFFYVIVYFIFEFNFEGAADIRFAVYRDFFRSLVQQALLVILRPRPVPSILAAELSRANGSKYALKLLRHSDAGIRDRKTKTNIICL